jgi:hypothetical protein
MKELTEMRARFGTLHSILTCFCSNHACFISRCLNYKCMKILTWNCLRPNSVRGTSRGSGKLRSQCSVPRTLAGQASEASRFLDSDCFLASYLVDAGHLSKIIKTLGKNIFVCTVELDHSKLCFFCYVCNIEINLRYNTWYFRSVHRRSFLTKKSWQTYIVTFDLSLCNTLNQPVSRYIQIFILTWNLTIVHYWKCFE